MLDEMCFGLDSKYDVIILLYCDYRITTQQLTLYSHEWPRQNFSLQHQYSIKQTSYENLQKLTRGLITWSNIKFSKLTSQEQYGRQ